LGLTVGKQFKYLFDFGDEWRFQCKVLQLIEGEVDDPEVVRSVGEAPKQYESTESGRFEEIEFP
jgi:hypothetical protein